MARKQNGPRTVIKNKPVKPVRKPKAVPARKSPAPSAKSSKRAKSSKIAKTAKSEKRAKSGGKKPAVGKDRKRQPARTASAPVARRDAQAARNDKARSVQAAAEKALAAQRREKVLLTIYERGLKSLYARNYQQAMDCFEKLIEEHPGEIELVDRARNFIKICQSQGATRRLQQPKSAEEMFDAGVLEHNRSNFQKAIDYFLGAIQLSPKGDYLHYALAASYAQLGQTDQSVRSLQKSIHLNSESRFHARNDPDFEPVRTSPEFLALMESFRSE